MTTEDNAIEYQESEKKAESFYIAIDLPRPFQARESDKSHSMSEINKLYFAFKGAKHYNMYRAFTGAITDALRRIDAENNKNLSEEEKTATTQEERDKYIATLKERGVKEGFIDIDDSKEIAMLKIGVQCLEQNNKIFSDVVTAIVKVFDAGHVYINEHAVLAGERRVSFNTTYSPEEFDQIYKSIITEVLKKRAPKNTDE